MYAKPSYRANDDMIIPENYRGNAFRELPQEEPPSLNGITPTSEALDCDEDASGANEACENAEKDEATPQGGLLASLLPPKVSRSNGILSNIGIEELLIIGVLILLSQSDADDDIMLLLFLLLFYK